MTSYTLDDANRLTGIDSRTSGNSVIAAFNYTLDDNGNRVSIDKQMPSAGTLPARNETADYLHNRLTATDSALYSYDNEGQLSSKQEGGTTTYSFDKAYRLTGIGTDTTFSYDGAGNRLRAVRGGVETHYIYDVDGNLLAEADANNTITRYYIHGAGLLAAVTPADAVYCYHYDATGNTVAITDGSETVVNSYDYSPFGMVISESETFAQPFKYVGKLGVMAEANGFYYMRARYYDPVNGRFISEDPLGFDGGDVNLYVYGANNPLLLVDPWGLTWQQDVEFVARGVGAFLVESHIYLAEQFSQQLVTALALGRIGRMAQLSHIESAVLDNSIKAGAILNAVGGTEGRDLAERIDSRISSIRTDVYGSGNTISQNNISGGIQSSNTNSYSGSYK